MSDDLHMLPSNGDVNVIAVGDVALRAAIDIAIGTSKIRRWWTTDDESALRLASYGNEGQVFPYEMDARQTFFIVKAWLDQCSNDLYLGGGVDFDGSAHPEGFRLIAGTSAGPNVCMEVSPMWALYGK